MAYNTYAVQFPTFQPAMRNIASITQTFPVEVTTTFAHQYDTGLIVRFKIPSADGMPELNNQLLPITVTGSTTFTVPIDGTQFEAFSIPVGTRNRVDIAALVIPVGEVNSKLNSATHNVLPY